MITKVKSATLIGIDACQIDVEIDSKKGLPTEHIVGLPDAVIKESKARIKTAIKNAGFEYLIRQYTINLAPADLPKEGAFFDLPIAVGLLVCNEQITIPPDTFFIGELSLDGKVKPVKGILAICQMIAKTHYKRIVVPEENKDEAGLIGTLSVIPIASLVDLITLDYESPFIPSKTLSTYQQKSELDYNEIMGQYLGKRAMEIVAAGQHNVLLIGPPGSGKSMLLQRLPSIMPPLTHAEAIETLKIKSISSPQHEFDTHITRPFRCPHHSISYAGLVGGGKKPLPGEISLAHNGILFLDELPEFNRQALEVLRQPLESGEVTISRANQSMTFPANFLLAAAMNPCPCGFATDPQVECSCSPYEKKRYLKKLSGPLIDRFDIIIEIPRLKHNDFTESTNKRESSDDIHQRINKAIKRQHERYELHIQNANISTKLFNEKIHLSFSQKNLLGNAIESGQLTARSCNKIIKVAQTIADLNEDSTINDHHINEAMHFRSPLKDI